MRRDVPGVVAPAPASQQSLARVGEWSLHLPFQAVADIPSLNERVHWTERARRAKAWRDATHVLARAARIPACSRVRVELHYVPATVRRRDPDNLVACLKPCIDGLVDAGVVPDDTEHFVERVFPIIHAAQATLPTRGESRFILRVLAIAR